MSSQRATDPSPSSGWDLSAIVRLLGAACFVGAGATFLVEGWTDSGIFERQMLWAVGTLALVGFAALAARRLGDPRGARVALGLAAASLPVHFAQLGAAIWERGVAASWGEVVGAGAMVIGLAPVLALGLKALVRRQAGRLTATLSVLCAALLLPTRNADTVAFIASVQVAAVLWLEASYMRRTQVFATAEGIAARVLLASPILIILVRNAFYPATRSWWAACLGLPSLAALVLPMLWGRVGPIARRAQALGAAGLIVALCVLLPDARLLAPSISLVAALAAELMPGEASMRALRLGVPALAFAALLAWLSPYPWYALLVVAAGALHAVSAHRRNAARSLLASIGFTLAAAAGHLSILVSLPVEHWWLTGAVCGLGLLALASLLDRHRSTVERFLGRLRVSQDEERGT